MTAPLSTLLRGGRVTWQEIGVPAERLIALCKHEELAGVVLHHVRENGEGDWPEAFLFEIERSALEQAARDMLRRKELKSVIDALEINRVQPILFKGTALASMVYPWSLMRPSSDTDLMIRREDFGRVLQALVPLDYRETNYSGGEQLFCQFEMQKTDEFGLSHALDFHWKVSTQTLFADLLSYEELERESATLPGISSMTRGAGVLHSLLIACVHPVMHHRNEERLIWLYDIHLLAQRLSGAEWQRFHRLALAKGVGAICAHELATARERLGTIIPAGIIEVLGSARQSERTAAYLEPGRQWKDELVANVRELPSWRARLRLLREVAFPKPGYMMRSYGVGGVLGATLLPLLYVHRGLRGVWRVMTGEK